MTMEPVSPAAARSSAVPLFIHFHRGAAAAVVTALFVSTPSLFAQTAPKAPAPQTNAAATRSAPKPPAGARGFATAQAAADALIQAASTFDEAALVAIVGPEGKDLVTTEDPVRDKNYSLAFAALAHDAQKVTVSPSNPNRATLEVGNEAWPLPLPLVGIGGKWYFDAKAGRDEILFRRIGANELDAIEVCRGFVEAQEEYALESHDESGVRQYAQRVISTPGKQDGLYWKNADGSPGGPISETVARAIDEGYSVDAASSYHGYYFKVLKGQGPDAPLGQMDYVVNGAMIGGFALVAFPAQYKVTGVKTFMVSNDGVVYEKDLGPNTVELAQKIERFNPDKSWNPVAEE
jgi:Protein of unknown function (DUF2950)